MNLTTFWGRPQEDWRDIYCLLKFQGNEPKSFKDLIAWQSPNSPQGCVNLAFDLAEARAAKYDNPVPEWIRNILINDKRDLRDNPDKPK